jgi:exodeoxyribonuclease-3
MFKVASWNLNSVRSRLTHVTAWLKAREPDVLLLQELKGTEFPSEAFKSLGYESVAVTQKAYNGVAVLSRHPMKTIAKALVGDDSDSHARFLEVIIKDIRIVNIYVPNGNPIGSDKFAYKLAWMDRLTQQMIRWKQDDVPTLIGGDFNVIPEDIDCHKPSSWEHDALFQPEPRARYRAMLGIGYTDAFRSLHVGEIGHFTFWDYFHLIGFVSFAALAASKFALGSLTAFGLTVALILNLILGLWPLCSKDTIGCVCIGRSAYTRACCTATDRNPATK